MRGRGLLLGFVTFWVTAGAALAAGGDACFRDALQEVLQKAQDFSLLKSEKDLIAEIYASDRPPREKIDAAVEVFAEAQARGVEEAVRNRFAKVTVVVATSKDDPEKFRPFYIPMKLNENVSEGVVKVLMPERYHDTLVEAYVKSHEYQHGLNHVQLTDKIPGFDYRKLPLEEQIYHRFIDEMTAMIAEYHFLNAIPREERQAMIAVLRADTSLDRHAKEFMLRSLEVAGVDNVGDYLQVQFAHGRYTPEAIEWMLRQSQNPQIAEKRADQNFIDVFKTRTGRSHRTLSPAPKPPATGGKVTGFTMLGFVGACASLRASAIKSEALQDTFCAAASPEAN